MKQFVLTAAAALLALSSAAAPQSDAPQPVRHMPRPSLMRRATPHIVPYDSIGPSFMFPAVGNTPGVGGTFFKSDVTISNYRDATQRILITVLPQGGANLNVTPIPVDLPAYSENGDLGYVTENFLQSIGRTGLAAVLVQAVDSSGAPDPTAQIDGFSRIWTPVPPSDSCSAPVGTMSQSLFAVPMDAIHGADLSAFSVGLRQDENFRTNIGIVNLGKTTKTWRIDAVGTRADVPEFTVIVPAMSLSQVSLPAGIYGTVSIAFTVAVTPGAPADDFNWSAYASSVDNRSGDAWTRQASY